MHADIDERAKRGDVRDDALEGHVLLHVVDRHHVVPERRLLEHGARVAARLYKFAHDIVKSLNTEVECGNCSLGTVGIFDFCGLEGCLVDCLAVFLIGYIEAFSENFLPGFSIADESASLEPWIADVAKV